MMDKFGKMTTGEAKYAVRYLRKLAGLTGAGSMAGIYPPIPAKRRREIEAVIRELVANAADREWAWPS